MNSSIIRYILGSVLKIEGLFLFLPAGIACIYHEQEGFTMQGLQLPAFCSAFL